MAVLPSEEFCIDLFLTSFVVDSEDVSEILVLWIISATELLEVGPPPVRAIVWPIDDIEVCVVMRATIVIHLDSHALCCQELVNFLTDRFNAHVLVDCLGHFSTLGNCLQMLPMLLLVPTIASCGLCQSADPRTSLNVG